MTYLVNKLKNWLTRRLYCLPDMKWVIHEDKGIVYLGGQQISWVELRSLADEARTIESLRLWTVFQETLRNNALRTGMTESKSWAQMETAKSMLLALDELKSIVKIILKLETRIKS